MGHSKTKWNLLFFNLLENIFINHNQIYKKILKLVLHLKLFYVIKNYLNINLFLLQIIFLIFLQFVFFIIYILLKNDFLNFLPIVIVVAISSLVEKTIESGNRENMIVHIDATVPSISQDIVAKFKLTLSLKDKR